MTRMLGRWMLAMTAALSPTVMAQSSPAQTAKAAQTVLIFIPAYEGSALFDPGLAPPGGEAPCVWGSFDAIRRQELYYALRMPNRLEARLLLAAGPVEVYRGFVDALTQPDNQVAGFQPRELNRDFFVFSYDWRQDMNTVTAPDLGRFLLQFPAQTRFIIVAHSMGGLVLRTLLAQQPVWADRIERAWLLGTPNLGSAKAIKTILVGPGGLRDNDVGFPGNLLKLLPNDVDGAVSRMVAITRTSLYELLPTEDPRWEVVDDRGRSSRVADTDLLRVGTWQRYWPSSEAERRLYLQPWRTKFMGDAGEPLDARAWEFCQDPGFVPLQTILAAVRDWRQQVGTLQFTNQLLTRAGEPSRLLLVAGTGLSTPTGVISEGSGDAVRTRYTYDLEAEGDETVTVQSALGGINDSRQTLLLKDVSHAKLVLDPNFLQALKRDVALIDSQTVRTSGTRP